MAPRVEKFADIDAHILSSTDHALLTRNAKGQEVWLPKSQLTKNDDGEIVIPEWLMIKKELV